MGKLMDVSIILLGLVFYLGCNLDGEFKHYHSDIRDPNIPDSLFALLIDDAKLIAQQYIFEQDLSEKSFIELPNQYVSPILMALQKVYEDPQQTVARLNIHAFCPKQLHKIILRGDPNSQVIQLWLKGETTSNSTLDALIKKYQLQLSSLGTSSNFFIVESEMGLNMRALSEALNSIKGMEMAEPNLCAGDGSKIKLLDFNFSYLDLEFSYGWGDCPAGCIYRHYWRIRIFSNGKIEKLKEFGEDLP